MSAWVHKYRVVDVGSQATITGHTPGQKIALVLEDIQGRVPNDVEGESPITAEIVGNTLTLSLDIEALKSMLELDSGDMLPDGGEEHQVLQRNAEGEAVWDWVRMHG